MKNTLILLILLIAGWAHSQNNFFLDGNRETSSSRQLLEAFRGKRAPIMRGGGFSSEDSSAFQSILLKVLTDSNDIGLAAGIADNINLWSGVENHPSLSAQAKMTRDYVLGIGSNTKSITATAILLLMEDGKLSLEDSLKQWLHDYDHIDHDITIRQCLQMTSGIYNFTDHPNFFNAISANPTRRWTPEEILTTFVRAPLFEKGTSWSYSNTNYLLLGLIIEKASGMPYPQFVRQRILEPLKLNSFSFYPLEAPKAPMAHAWVDINKDKKPDDLTAIGFSLQSFFSAAGAAGAYLGTAQDLARWNHALFTGKILSPSSLHEMKKVYNLGKDSGYGLGVIVLHTPAGDLWGHNGSIIYQSMVYYSPDWDFSVSVITNNIHDLFSLTPVFNGLFSTYYSRLITAIETPAQDHRFVYTSLFDDEIRIHSKAGQIQSYSVYNMKGERVTGQSAHLSTPDLRIESTFWPKGLYLIHLRTEDGRYRVLRGMKW